MAKYITKLISGETMYYLKDSEARESLGNKVDTTDSRLSDARPASNTVDTYSSTGTDPVSGKAVAAAIGTLDVSSVGGTNKYIKTISETNGKISATAGTVDTSVTADSSNLITSGAVKAAIDALPEPMVFKGSLGTGGTVTSLPTAAAANKGFTYKVITAGTYASQTAKVGDTFISDGSSWILIPSGDEPSGTVTSVTIKATSPISIDSSAAITSSGTRTISHAASGVTAGTYKSVTVDAKGHVTAGTNPTTLAGYGITDAAVNKELTDENLNNITTPGFYNAGGSNTVTNKPSGVTSFGLEVVHSASGSYYTLIIYKSGESTSYRRNCSGGTWSSWVKDELTDTNTHVLQSSTTTANWRKIALGAQNDASSGTAVTEKTDQVYVTPTVEVQPSTGTLKATALSATTLNGVTIGESPKFTDTNTKVTSAANHYAPTPDASSELTATISGTAGAYAKDTEYTVLTGVKAQRDAKGHVTGITYTAQKIKDTNTNTTYSNMTGATSTAAGTAGLVPAPAKGKLTSFLRGDGTWVIPTDTNTTYSAGTGLSLSGTTFSLALTKALVTGALGYTPPTTDTNTWRTVLCNGTSIGNNTLNLKAGTNVTLSNSSGAITISSTDTMPAAQILPANTSGDANTMQLDGKGTEYSVLTNYNTNTKWQNMPTFGDNSYGGVVEIKGKDSSLKMQFAWAAFHGNTTAPTEGLWYRARADKGYIASDWRKVAFTDSNITGNAATATKLKNTRTLWGNDFNGTANVGGNIILDEGDGGRQVKITKNGTFQVRASTGGMAGGLAATTNDGSTTLGTFGYLCSGDTLTHLYIGDSYSSPWASFLPTGNVGIGTTSPTEKLHVSGNVKATKFIGDISGCTGLTSSQIPSLAASKITSGTFAAARIPDLSGTYATSSRASTLEGYFTGGNAKTAMQLICGVSYDGGKGVTNPYHVVAEYSLTNVTTDKNTTAMFLVDSHNGARGILVVQARVDAGSSTINSTSTFAKWILKPRSVNLNEFILTTKVTSSSLTCKLYHKITAQWKHARLRIIDEGSWAVNASRWQLITTNSDTAGDYIKSAIPSDETQFVSTVEYGDAFTGATSSAAGKDGVVPAPAAGDQAKFLRGDGTWVVPTDTNTDTKVTSTKTEPALTATWYALCTTSSDTATGSAVKSPGVRFLMLYGTAETAGFSRLDLGNTTATGTAGNMKGSILMYGPTGKYAHIVPHDGDTLHRTIYTPKASGTLVVHTTDTAIGSPTKPVYISAAGVATAIGHTIEANVPSGAKFTDTTYSAGTLALYNTGTDTANRVWSASVLKSIGNKYLPLAGGTMTGSVDFGNKKMTGVSDIDGIVQLEHYSNPTTPTNDSYACRVHYKDTDNRYIELINSTSTCGLRYYDAGDEANLWMICHEDGYPLYVGDYSKVTTVRGENIRLLCYDSLTGGNYCFLANKEGNVCIGRYADRVYTYKLNVVGAVGATGYNNTSDIRKKDIIENVDLSVEDIANAPIFKFLWLDPEMDRGVNVGSSAQYWQTVLPEIVSEADDDEKTLSMQYGVAALTSSVTLAKKVVEQEKTIKAQEERIKALEDAILEILSKLNN